MGYEVPDGSMDFLRCFRYYDELASISKGVTL